MDELKVLIKSMRQDPLNETLRLMYADELEVRGQILNAASHRIIAQPHEMFHREELAKLFEQNGDPARAEMIRLRIRLRDIPMRDPARMERCTECGKTPDEDGVITHQMTCGVITHQITCSAWFHNRPQLGPALRTEIVPVDPQWEFLTRRSSELITSHEVKWRMGPLCPKCSKASTPDLKCDYCGGAVDGGGLLERREERNGIDHVFQFPISYQTDDNPGCKRILVADIKDMWESVETEQGHFKYYRPSHILLRLVRHPDTIEILPVSSAPHWNGLLWCYYAKDRKAASGAVPATAEVAPELLKWMSNPDKYSVKDRFVGYRYFAQATLEMSRAIVKWAVTR